jgi:glucosamine--fructose-6-phosphate aminotransferase (isomerizing)
MRFAIDEQIASQPQVLRALLARIDVPELDPARPLIFAGIGTSLHACRVAAYWCVTLSNGALHPHVLNAHELALSFPLSARDQVVVVSHRGTKQYSRAALTRARQIGASTVAIVGEDAPEQDAQFIVRTCPGERSGTHTVSYSTSLAVLAHLVARLVGAAGNELLGALRQVPDVLDNILVTPEPVVIARQLVGREPLLMSGVEIDAVTAAEIALKFKEGTYQWAEGFETENALHGPPAVMRAGMGAITLTPDRDDGGRTKDLRTLFSDLGVTAFTCGDHADDDLRFPVVSHLVRPFVAIVPLQRLVAEIAGIKHSNPDEIHRDVEPWNTAMGRVTL